MTFFDAIRFPTRRVECFRFGSGVMGDIITKKTRFR